MKPSLRSISGLFSVSLLLATARASRQPTRVNLAAEILDVERAPEAFAQQHGIV